MRTDLSGQYAFGHIGSLGQALDRLIMPGFTIAGLAVIFYFLFAAFKYLTSGGDKNAIASARGMITHAIVGFILLMLIFIIFQYIPTRFGIEVHLIGE